MNVRLLGDRIMVKLDRPMQQRDVGDGKVLFYPEGSHGAASEVQVWGTVIDVGPGKWAKNKAGTELGFRLPMDVKKGDRVYVLWYLIKVETNKALSALLGEDTLIVTPSDIIAVEPCNEGEAQPAG